MQAHLPQHCVLGIGGDATDHCVWRLDEGGLIEALETANIKHAKRVLILLGRNDLSRGSKSSSEGLVDNMIHITSRLRSVYVTPAGAASGATAATTTSTSGSPTTNTAAAAAATTPAAGRYLMRLCMMFLCLSPLHRFRLIQLSSLEHVAVHSGRV